MEHPYPHTSQPELRRLILDTTRHLLVRDGYKSLSMRKIARAIGYSATSIYLHFENKDALFHALIDEGMEQLYHRLEAVIAASPDDPVVRLQGLCRGYVAFGLENPEYYEVMFMLHPEQMHRYPVEKYRKARRNLDVFAEALAEGARRGVLLAEEPEIAARAIWAALHGAVSLLIARRIDVRVDPERFIETAVAHIVRGMMPGVRAEVPSAG